jgi:hypothetical protein
LGSMGEEEELNPGVGRVSLRRGKKKDGANWVMFAGGAIAMAVSVAFGRKKILEEAAEAKEALTEPERTQPSHQQGILLKCTTPCTDSNSPLWISP